MSWAGDFVAVNRKAKEVSPAQAPFALPELITITIDLPYPVSTNRIWRYGKGRVYRSELYKEWMADADAHALTQLRGARPMIRGMFDAHIYLSQEGGRLEHRQHQVPAGLGAVAPAHLQQQALPPAHDRAHRS